MIDNEINNADLLRAKAAHITKAARSATLANILAPLLCIPMFEDEVQALNLGLWLGYMGIAVFIRTWMIYRLAHEAERILDPRHNLNIMTVAVGIVGVGWGLGWILMAPDLLMVNRMIYVYMTTAAMISSMFAYSVNRATFLAFTLPIMVPSLSTVLWEIQIFPWPFLVGLASLYIVVLSIAKNFAKTFENSVRLRFRNERLYHELAAERDQSIAANVAKSKFIAAASHDLRQPMHAVNIYLELVNSDSLPAVEKQWFAKIKSSITTLNAMFESLLNISKLDADAMPVNHRVFRLEELAITVRDVTEAKATAKGLQFNVVCPDLIVCGDIVLLQQIIGNLVSNAIQYTEHGHVAVRFASENDCLVIEVRDTGYGIAASEHQHIFNQFYRTDKTRALHDGLGLGLSIVKRLCNLIVADITLVSEPGSGSTFIVTTTFPTSTTPERMVVERPMPKTHNGHRSLQGKTIAVIDDNPVIIDGYRQTLSSKGAQVLVLSEYEDVLNDQLATIDRIDGILIDYRLSQTTGDVLIQKLRDNFNTEIPAIIVTADTSPSHINLFAQLHVQVLHKPISFQEVIAAIDKVVTVGIRANTRRPDDGTA